MNRPKNQPPAAPSEDAQFVAFLIFFALMIGALAACGGLR